MAPGDGRCRSRADARRGARPSGRAYDQIRLGEVERPARRPARGRTWSEPEPRATGLGAMRQPRSPHPRQPAHNQDRHSRKRPPMSDRSPNRAWERATATAFDASHRDPGGASRHRWMSTHASELLRKRSTQGQWTGARRASTRRLPRRGEARGLKYGVVSALGHSARELLANRQYLTF